MKKYSLSEIMRRAWEIKKEDSRNIFSLCLEMAWEEAKGEKKEFTGYAEIDSESNMMTMYSFSAWKKYGKNRIYCNYRGRRPAGYIDLNDNNRIVTDCEAYAAAMQDFMKMYNIA